MKLDGAAVTTALLLYSAIAVAEEPKSPPTNHSLVEQVDTLQQQLRSLSEQAAEQKACKDANLKKFREAWDANEALMSKVRNEWEELKRHSPIGLIAGLCVKGDIACAIAGLDSELQDQEKVDKFALQKSDYLWEMSDLQHTHLLELERFVTTDCTK
jgi:hypothetical protein